MKKTSSEPHGLTGNKNAAKAESEKVSGKGRLTVDLGSLKTRLDRAASKEGVKLKPLVVELLEDGLRRKGL